MKRPGGWKVRVALAVCGVVAGFAVAAGVLYVVRGGFPGGDVPGRGAAAASPRAVPSVLHGAGGLSPQALDAQWLAYSDHSNCADWAGGDGVSAIRLSSSQIAWFFADTYLGPAGPTTGFSHLGGFLHNSVVIQTTAGNQTRLVTLTGGGGCAAGSQAGPAASVVSAPTTAAVPQRYWDADGVRVGRTVVKFYNSYLFGRAPYVPTGTTMASFSVGQLSAAGRTQDDGGAIRPVLVPIPAYTPPGGGTPIIWGSALLRSGSTVYIYGWQSPAVSSSQRLLYLARVSAPRLTDFAAWQFYSGGRWSASQSLAGPIEPVAQDLDVPTGFSVVPIAGRYWLIQAMGLGDPDIYAYPASTPWGPFDARDGILLYRAPGIGLNAANDYRVMYEARAEPALSTSKTLVISYNVNSEAVTGACSSIAWYTNAFIQPQFISVPVRAFLAPDAAMRDLVRAVRPGHLQIIQHHPAEWFDSLSFPGGCPPVPGVSHLTARTSAGRVRLAWPSAGIGMRYRVYLSSGSQGFEYVRMVSSPRVTITGLTPGVTYDFEVVPVNVHSNTGPAAYMSVQMP
jgi:hypothetical protein